MPVPWIPVFIVGLATAAYVRAGKRTAKGVLTPEREAVLKAALETVQDPAKLRSLADVYEKEGLKDEAELLRKRAKLRELPKAVKDARQAAFRETLKSKDPVAVRRVAAAFRKEGCTGAAAKLEEYAKGLEVAAKAA